MKRVVTRAMTTAATALAIDGASVLRAQDVPRSPAPDARTTGPDVIVRGTRPGAVRGFVDKLTAVPPNMQVPRWNRYVCVVVDGVARDRKEYLETKIAGIAQSLHVPARAGQCSATQKILVRVLFQADEYTRRLVKARPGLYRNTNVYGLASHEEIANLLKPRPVRWFDAHETTYPGSSPVGQTSAERVVETGSSLDPGTPSHITRTSREDKELAFLIVDATKLNGVTWQQLADYLAMVALTEPEMDRSYRTDDTILGLFQRRDAGLSTPPGLTDLDHATLISYYRSSDELSGAMQRQQIQHGVQAGRTPPPL